MNGLVGSSWVVDRDYDANGYLTQTLVNLGGTISGSSISGGITDLINQYVYDDMSRLFSVQQRGNIDGTGALLANSNAVAPKTVTYNYNLASQVTDVRRYSDTSSTNLEVHTRNTYDLAGRLKSITHGKSEIAAGQSWNGTSTLPASLGAANMLAGYFMVYDRDNRLTSLASQKDAFRTTYTYNTDDELTAATSTQIAGMTLPNPLPAAAPNNGLLSTIEATEMVLFTVTDVWDLGETIHVIGTVKLPRSTTFNAPEQHVFDLLENSKKRWNALNFREQQNAIEYVERIGGFR